jgi:tetratricopeptide (TPR) repeat protein
LEGLESKVVYRIYGGEGMGKGKRLFLMVGVSLFLLLMSVVCARGLRSPDVTWLYSETAAITSTIPVTSIHTPETQRTAILVPTQSTMIGVNSPGIDGICPENKVVSEDEYLSQLEPLGDYDQSQLTFYRNLMTDEILFLLNTYGSAAFIQFLNNNDQKFFYTPSGDEIDLTADSVPELIVRMGSLEVYGCNRGQYVLLFNDPPDGMLRAPRVIAVKDGNLNGIPEILILTSTQSQGGRYYKVYEYSAGSFKTLIDPDSGFVDGVIFVEVTGSIKFIDVDHDGYSEIYSLVGIPVWSTYETFVPWRKEWDTYEWDGTYYTLSRRDFAPPEYRYQAAYDGDNFSLRGEYDQAIESYRRVILSDGLQWYTQERAEYVKELFFAGFNNDMKPTLSSPDPAEYPNLAAYAHYRIMLIHALQGSIVDAQFELNKLQKEYPEGDPGSIYAQLARIFLEEFQVIGDMGKSCAEVIEVVKKNQRDVFKYLGIDGYMGMYIPKYTPQDICPFE